VLYSLEQLHRGHLDNEGGLFLVAGQTEDKNTDKCGSIATFRCPAATITYKYGVTVGRRDMLSDFAVPLGAIRTVVEMTAMRTHADEDLI